MTKIKILQVVHHFIPYYGGGPIHVLNVARCLARQGYHIDILTSNLIDNFHTIKYPRIFHLSKNLILFRSNIIRVIPKRESSYILYDLIKFITSNKYRIIHVHGYRFFPFYGALLTKLLMKNLIKSRIIATPHYIPETLKISRSLLANIHDALALKYIDLFDKIIALTDVEKYFYCKYIDDCSKIEVIPHCVSQSFEYYIKSTLAMRENLRRTWGVEDKFVLLYIGRLSREKNPSLILKAIKLLPDQIRKKLVLILAGPDLGELRHILELSRSLNLIDSIRYVGTADDYKKAVLMTIADLLVLPSLKETFSIVMIEAMTAGLPLLVTKIGGPKLIIKEGVNGYTFDPFSEHDLASKIEYLYNNYNTLKEIRTNNIIESKKYSFENVCNKYKDLYKKLIQ